MPSVIDIFRCNSFASHISVNEKMAEFDKRDASQVDKPSTSHTWAEIAAKSLPKQQFRTRYDHPGGEEVRRSEIEEATRVLVKALEVMRAAARSTVKATKDVASAAYQLGQSLCW